MIVKTGCRTDGALHSSKPYPDTVENIPVGEYSHIQVGLNDVVELGLLLIPEKCVGHPDLSSNNSKRGLVA